MGRVMLQSIENLNRLFGLRVLRDKLRDTQLIHQYQSIKRRLRRQAEGEAILLRRYVHIHGKPLNLTNPQTYTEKLFWRMITWNRGGMPPRITQLADKYAVRSYVARTVGEQHLIREGLIYSPCGMC